VRSASTLSQRPRQLPASWETSLWVLGGATSSLGDAKILLGAFQPHRSKVPLEKALAKLTHLPLNEKGYTKICNLKQCTGLRVLYLYDNRIERIEGLDFGNTLTHLYLQASQKPLPCSLS
jgi:hypothetical protein